MMEANDDEGEMGEEEEVEGESMESEREME